MGRLGKGEQVERQTHAATAPALIAIALATIAVQLWRVLCGLDFNDEMQYYGELVSLLDHNRLFATDLFLQQNVDLLLYPILKPYTLLAGHWGLIVAVRGLFAALVLAVAWRTYASLRSVGTAAIPAALAGLAITFALPLTNVYSVSYNTVSLALFGLCLAEFVDWLGRNGRPRLWFWAVVLPLMLLVYPPLGVVVSAVAVARLLAAGQRAWLWPALWRGALASAVLLALYFCFADLADLGQALAFSKAFGVAQVIRGERFYLKVLAFVLVGVPAGLALARSGRLAGWLDRPVLRWLGLAAVALGAGLACTFAVGRAEWQFPLAALALVLTTLAALLVAVTPMQVPAVAWVACLYVAAGATMAVTSGNGFRQIQWPSLAAVPALTGLLWLHSERIAAARRGPWRWAPPLLTASSLALALELFLLHPYGDQPLYRSTQPVVGAPALAGLYATPEKAAAVAAARAALGDVVPGSHVMVVGAQPWLYQALDLWPDTDMIFMHPYSAIEGQELLGARLLQRRPAVILVAAETSAPVHTAVVQLLQTYQCQTRRTPADLGDAHKRLQTFFDLVPDLQVCRPKPPAKPAP